MKESDAKTKWCPHVRQVNHANEPCGNRIGMETSSVAWEHSKCIASDCMMWEQYQKLEEKEQPNLPDGDGWSLRYAGHWTRLVDSENGDCGLKPFCNGCSYPG